MTAVNLFVAADRAHLLTDRAQYHDDGTVLGIVQKAIINQRLHIAVAANGYFTSTTNDDLAAWLASCRDQSEVLSTAPSFVATAQGETADLLSSAGPGSENLTAVVQLFLAMFDQGRRAPAAFIVSGNAGTFGAGYEPHTIRRVSSLVSPPVNPALYPKPDGRALPTVARRLIEAQRHVADERGIYRVGGGADLVSVGADGVRVRGLVTWKDKVGQRLAPKRCIAAK